MQVEVLELGGAYLRALAIAHYVLCQASTHTKQGCAEGIHVTYIVTCAKIHQIEWHYH